jgi:hypothetical protein
MDNPRHRHRIKFEDIKNKVQLYSDRPGTSGAEPAVPLSITILVHFKICEE